MRPILAGVKKPPSRFKRGLREAQLVVSLGAAVIIAYALITAALVMRVSPPEVSSRFWLLVCGALLSHGTLLVIAPTLCFVTCLAVDVHPWRLGLGSVAVVEVGLLLLSFVTGNLEMRGLDALLAMQLLVCGLAGVLSSLAARAALRRVAAGHAAEPLAAPAAPDFAEQMRQAQQVVAAPEPAAAPESAAPSEPPAS